MTRAELTKLTEIRDGFKSAYWDFDKWRWAAKFDQFIADAEHALAGGTVAKDSGPSTERPEGNP
jgi:hypothetical protein